MAEKQKRQRKPRTNVDPAVHTATFQLRIEPALIAEAKRRARIRKPEKVSASVWIREAMRAKIDMEDGKIKPSPEVQALDVLVQKRMDETAAIIEKYRKRGAP